MVKPAYIKPYWGREIRVYQCNNVYIYNIYIYIYKSFLSIGGNHPFVFGGANQFELFSTHKGEGPTEEQMIRPAQNQDIWRFQPTNHQEIVFWFQ